MFYKSVFCHSQSMLIAEAFEHLNAGGIQTKRLSNHRRASTNKNRNYHCRVLKQISLTYLYPKLLSRY